ncbi:MAG: SH3 domain-containing protein [Clostridia bacterium]|nr:SH3 domain-containing protein [Clostridia bacterium]
MRRSISAVLCAAVILSFCTFFASAKESYPMAGRVSTASGNLNVRSSAGGNIVSSLQKDSYVNLISLENGWYKVEYAAGRYGYSSADFIKALLNSYPATVKTTSGGLNVRSSAGGTIINSLASGTRVTVISTSGDWSRIIYHGIRTGWVSSKYLVTGTQNSYKAISLKVPDYKQTDSRWANKKIGSTKYTIGQIGCTTTALAMTESYRTGKTVYPDTMESRLSYSSGGSLYWPNNYSATTNFTNYMQTIYNLLAQGKPVIVGAKKANGSQHWVVVTGYTGASTLKPTAFKINDPGTASRTNLGQFFTEFPYLHKIVWYN